MVWLLIRELRVCLIRRIPKFSQILMRGSEVFGQDLQDGQDESIQGYVDEGRVSIL